MIAAPSVEREVRDVETSSLLLLRAGAPQLKLPLAVRCTVGRSSDCDLQLLDHQLSREHARIERRPDGYWLSDLGSRNGTFLGGVRLTAPVRLTAGDEISLGSTRLIFEPPLDLLPERGGHRTLCLVDEAPAPGGPVEGALAADAPETLDASTLLAVHRLSCELSAELEPDALCGLLLDRLLDFFGADRGFVLLSSARSGRLTPAVIRADGDRVAISRALVDHTLERKTPVRVADAIADVTFEGARSVVAHQLRSVMLAPLLADGEVLGVVQVDHKQRDAFGAAHLTQLALLARSAAVALANAQRFAAERRRAREAAAAEPALMEAVSAPDTGFLSGDPRIAKLLTAARKAAAAGSRVLVTGESGTGKELVARLLHEHSERADGPWVALNCGAVPETLLESELFGHEKGAFSGATRRKRGCFELADEGTLFLDEVGELPGPMQVKLLRVLQESTFFRVGGEQPVTVDVRVVAATNRQLPEQVAAGRFREDLYYRLAVLVLALPPLRERPGDVTLLLDHFLQRYALRLGKPTPTLTAAASAALERYRWPGNVRELMNLAERLVVLGEGPTLDLGALPAEVSVGGLGPPRGPLKEVLAETERRLVAQALQEAGGKKVEACRLLGISRPTLDKKIADYGLEW